MAGQVDFGLVPGTVFPAVKAGKLKPLAVASSQRPPNRPDAPTLAEAGVPGVYADTLFGVYAPIAMPSIHVQRLNQAINRLLATEPIKARFAELGADAVPLSPEAFKALVAGEVKVFGGIVGGEGDSGGLRSAARGASLDQSGLRLHASPNSCFRPTRSVDDAKVLRTTTDVHSWLATSVLAPTKGPT